ncbi:MAG TPA: DHA2 family efflux MFS transporter permease subunit [Candidatus Dormibacteraeota bacterium]
MALATFMTLLDVTIVNIAIPTMLTNLHAGLDQALWVVNGYSLTYAVLLITSGRLGDIWGPRNLFMAGVGLFTAASALSGLSQTPEQLIAARALQGVAAALLAPQTLPMMVGLFPPDRRGGVFAIYGMIAGLAVVAGPTLGGYLVTSFGWRWIFFVNVPVGLAILALSRPVIPDFRPGLPHRLDLAGVALVTAALVCLVFGLIEGQRYDWGTVTGPITIPEIIGLGVLLFAGFVWHQARRQGGEPLVPFAVFADRNFAVATIVICAMGFAILGLYLPLTIYYQSVLGLTAIAAGLTIAVQPVTMFFAAGMVNGPLAQKVPAKYLLMAGLLLLAAGSAFIALKAQPGSGRWDFVPGLVVSGLGMSCIWGPIFALGTRDLKPQVAGVASGVINTVQELGSVVASAAVGALLQNRLAAALHDRAVAAAAGLPPAFRPGFIDGFAQAARHGFDAGAGQNGLALGSAPPAILQAAHWVFANGFVDAMRPTLVLPIAVIVIAAAVTLAARSR